LRDGFTSGTTRSHVGGRVDLIGQLLHLDLKPRLNLVENLGVVVGRHEGDGQTLGAETTRSTDAMQVHVGRLGHVIVDDNVDAFEVYTTAEDVGGHQDTGLVVLELVVALDTVDGTIKDQSASPLYRTVLVNIEYAPLLLRQTTEDGDGGEVALHQQLVELLAAPNTVHEDDNLVELQSIQQVVQLAVLLRLRELDVVLLQTVQRELALIVDVDLDGLWNQHNGYKARMVGQNQCNVVHQRGGGLAVVQHLTF